MYFQSILQNIPHLEAESPVGGHGEPEAAGEGEAALVSDQIHDGQVKLLRGEAVHQLCVLQHHPAVDVVVSPVLYCCILYRVSPQKSVILGKCSLSPTKIS